MKKLLSVLALVLVCAIALSACGGSTRKPGDDGVLKIGATAAPHAEILEAAQELMAAKGYKLEITVFDDYVLPNTALSEGDLDCNYFQHKPYLTSFNEENKTELVSAGTVHYEPLGIYPGKGTDLASLADGASVGIPNDGSNEARALYLLENEGLITVNHDAGFAATPLDITANAHNINFVEMDADKLPAAVADLDFAVINGNYAIAAGINETVLVTEDANGESAQTYANIIAVRAGDEENEAIKALLEVLHSDEIKQFIADKYQGSVVALD